MQQTAFRDKNSRRGNFPRRLTSRKPTFILFNKLRNEIPIFFRATPFLLSFYLFITRYFYVQKTCGIWRALHRIFA